MSRQSADRCMLFGLLALQTGVVTRDQLVIAFSKWTGDKTRSIDQILIDNGAVEQRLAEALRQMVMAHVEQNHGDSQESLLAVRSSDLPEVISELRALDDTEIEKSLWQLSEACANRRGADSGLTLSLGPRANLGGRYRLLRPLEGGRGGMGIINVAHDEELGREVALKQIRAEHADSEEYRTKFRVEAEITGKLEHPGVVPIYGLGADSDGRPFYAMRLVRGDNLSTAARKFHEDLCKSKTNFDSVEFHGLIDRLTDVAQAISYAHSRGVLHRDLKPGNILVGQYGETLVIDWGLARTPREETKSDAFALDALGPVKVRSGSDTSATVDGSAIGTLGYAPPEQVVGALSLIGRRSDVYSLGGILYYLLTKSSPVSTHRRNTAEIIHDTKEGRIVPPRQRNSEIPKSLSAVCMKALSREPMKRYASADELIKDLNRWQADQPVMARHEPIGEKLARLARRHGTATFVVTATILGLACVATYLINGQRQIANERSRQAIESEQRMIAVAHLARRFRYSSEMQLVGRALAEGNYSVAAELLESHLPADGVYDFRGFEWYHFWKKTFKSKESTIQVDGDGGQVVFVTDDGHYVVYRDSQESIVIYDLVTHARYLKWHVGATITALWADAETRRVIASDEHGRIHVWSDWQRTDDKKVIEAHEGAVCDLIRMPNGSGFATCGEDGVVRFWDDAFTASKRDLKTPWPCMSMTISPDSKSCVVIEGVYTQLVNLANVTMFDVETGRVRWAKGFVAADRFYAGRKRVAISPDNKEMVLALNARTLVALSMQDGEKIGDFDPMEASIGWVAFSPDGKTLAAVPFNGTDVSVWDSKTRNKLNVSLPHRMVRSASWLPDGRLVSASSHELYVWSLSGDNCREEKAEPFPGVSIRGFSATNADRFLTKSNGPMLRVWDVESRSPIYNAWFLQTGIIRTPLTSDGRTVYFRAGPEIHQKIRDQTPTKLFSPPESEAIGDFSLSNDGKQLAICTDTLSISTNSTVTRIRILDIERNKRLDEFDVSAPSVVKVLFSPDRMRLFLAGNEGGVRCWDRAKRRILWSQAARVATALACSPDGATLVIGTHRGHVEMFSSEDGTHLYSQSNRGTKVNYISFSGSGESYFVAYGNLGASVGEIQVRDTKTGQLRATLGRDLFPAMGVLLSADEKTLVTTHVDGRVVFWDAATDSEVQTEISSR